MVTFRNAIMQELAARLATITGWNVQLRSGENTGNHAITAIVFLLGEEKIDVKTPDYVARMTVGVELTARVVDADPDEDDGNPFLYIDRLVAEVEKQIHNPDEWTTPGFRDGRIDGHDVADPPDGEEFMHVAALVRLTFTYQHDVTSPEVPV